MAKSKTSRNISKKKRKNRGARKASSSRPRSRPSPQPVHEGPVMHVRSVAVFDDLVNGDKPVVVDFWADWCGPCRLMGPVFERVAADMNDRAHFVKVDTERAPAIATQFGIRSIPTLLVLQKGEVVDSHVGLTNEAGLAKMVRRAADRAEGVTLGDKVKRLFGRSSRESDSAAASASQS